MEKTIFVLMVAGLALASCKCKVGSKCSPAHPADSARVSGEAAKPVVPGIEPILKPTAEQIAAAHRVGNKHCPTDGEKVGSMGAPVPVIYKGELVELCCAGCLGEFANDPEKYLAIAKADTASSR